MENFVIKKIDVFRLLRKNKYVLSKALVHDILLGYQEENIKKFKFPISKTLERSILDQIGYINKGHIVAIESL
jgi:hypothetical protein